MPPFTSQAAPVAKSASAEASCSTRLATNSGLPRRFTGIISMSFSRRSGGTAARTEGSSMGPGAMALTVTPEAASSRAKILVRVRMPPFDAA